MQVLLLNVTLICNYQPRAVHSASLWGLYVREAALPSARSHLLKLSTAFLYLALAWS